MRKSLFMSIVLATTLAGRVLADDYTIDGAHAAATFKVSHLGLSWTHGRFNDVGGSFQLDPDPAKITFNLTIKADSVDTGNAKRDEHLKSPDFFNVKQFPVLTFKSTAVKPINNGYQVTGDLTLHGVTKSVTFPLVGGRKAEFPKGVQRTGFSTDMSLKRADFDMKNGAGAIGEDVYISISFEGTRK